MCRYVCGPRARARQSQPHSETCMDMCTDMCIDVCMDMRIDVGMDMRIDVGMDMRIDMCMDMRIDMCRHVYRHGYARSYTSIFTCRSRCRGTCLGTCPCVPPHYARVGTHIYTPVCARVYAHAHKHTMPPHMSTGRAVADVDTHVGVSSSLPLFSAF